MACSWNPFAVNIRTIKAEKKPYGLNQAKAHHDK